MSHAPTRPSLGIYGPERGQRSGIAIYIQRSLACLEDGFACVRAGRDDPHRFDVVLYHLGNNVFHHDAFRALRSRPGPVVLHEFNNLDYYYQCWPRLSGNEQQRILTLLGQALGHNFPDLNALEYHFSAHPELDRYSIDARCEQLVIEAATVTFVHSEHSAAVLRRRYPTARVEILPFPVTPIRQGQTSAVRVHLGLPLDAFVFGVFGFLGEYKRLEQIIDAWHRWPDRPDDVLLVFAGERQYLLRIPVDCHSIRTTGYLDNDVFDALILSVDCGIQLRFPSLGETSGPISTLLAHRRPVILSDIPQMRCYAKRQALTYVPVGRGEVPALIKAMRHRVHHRADPPSYDDSFSWEVWRAAIFKELKA